MGIENFPNVNQDIKKDNLQDEQHENIDSKENTEEKNQDKLYSLKDDERFKKFFEEKSLEYLKAKDGDYFDKEYSGVGDDGYLIYRNGEKGGLPSQNIGGTLSDGKKFTEFVADVEKEFLDQNPDIEAQLKENAN
jgi:hypothetical protein